MNRSTIYALCAVLCWSTVATAFKVALKGLSYFELLLISSTTALLFLSVIVVVQGNIGKLRSLSTSDIFRFAMLGVLNPVAYYLVLFKAYSLLPAQIAQPLNYSWPIVLLLMVAMYTKQKIAWQKYLGLVISLAGVAVISLFSGKGDTAISGIGMFLALSSAFLWALYWLATSNSRYDGTLSLFLTFLFGTVYLWVMTIFTGFSLPAFPSLLAGAYVGLFEMGIPFLFWGLAMRTTNNPALTNQLCYLSPFMSLFLIGMLLGEKILSTTYIGLVLIVAGIVFNQYIDTKIKIDRINRYGLFRPTSLVFELF